MKKTAWFRVLVAFWSVKATSLGSIHDLDRYVEDVRATFEIPGVAVAIVKDGEVIATRGYGVRTIGAAEKVDAHTLFGIASNTKAFTAAALAILVDEKRLGWEDRVQAHLPQFQLADAYISGELTVRDLLTHRSGLGLGAGDLMYWPTSDVTPSEVIERARHVPIVHSLRARFAYVNLPYVVAGELFPRIAGQSWPEFVRNRLLRPIGMHDTKPTWREAQLVQNRASPHVKAEWRRVQVAPFTNWDNAGPAGGMWSSASDLAKWMVVQLEGGRVPGADKPLFSPARHREMWTVVTPLAVNDPPAHLQPLRRMHRGFGLGWEVSDYRGTRMISHGGALAGLYSKVVLLPEHRLGVAVLTNIEHYAGYQSISLHVLDAFLNAPAFDWIAAYRKAIELEQAEHAKDWEQHVATRAKSAPPSLPLSAFAGVYRDAWYGGVSVEAAAEKLVMRFSRTPQLVGDLEHWHHNTFVVRWRDRTLNADAFVTFALNHDGAISEATMEYISPLTDFSFDFHDLRLKRVAPKAP